MSIDIRPTWPIALSFVMFSVCLATAQQDQTIEMKPGFSALIRLERPAGTAIVGDPAIADISLQPDNAMLVVTAKKSGSTNLIVLDTEKKVLLEREIIVARPPSADVVGTVHIQPTVNRNDLHNYQAYYCPPDGSLCVRVNDPVSNLTQLSRGESNQANPLPAVSGPPLALPPGAPVVPGGSGEGGGIGTPGEAGSGLQQ